jgi:DNA-binding LacI/PurR family transcriptional regulator
VWHSTKIYAEALKVYARQAYVAFANITGRAFMSGPAIKNMDQFAAISGISRPTVSKYFNDPNSVRRSSRERIEAAIEKHNYRPNIFAMNQNRALTKNIGIVVPLLSDPFFAEIARNLEQHCIDAGYRPTLFSAHGDPKLEEDVLDNLRSLKPAGVLLAPLGRASNNSILEKFCADVPTVLFDSEVGEFGVAFVGSDNAQFAVHITDYLCRTGEPPCFFEMKTPPNPNAEDRRQSYLDAAERFGFSPQLISVDGEGWSFEEIGFQGALKALSKGHFSTNTILCSNDRLAMGLLAACYQKGVLVGRGEDCAIRVAGQDEHPLSRYTCPALTTISHNYEVVSLRAAEALFAAIDGRVQPWKNTRIEGKLILRSSA